MNDRTPVQNVARLAGLVFLLVGIAGFIPGITTNLYDGLDFAGDGSEAELLGIFQVSVLHNIVHLLFGVGIFLAATPEGARNYLIGAGTIYLLLFVLGILGAADWIPANDADDWLHLVLGAGLLGAGLALSRDRERAVAT
ncbi:MAG: hypothetical protein K0T00_739 [Gaiellaceae bacterium]|jgi:hypothetical protein|nr:hypothetical protein [Gaiellaceae bacterium]